jgi:hypothetical protein
MSRISRKHLESKVVTINSLLGTPTESYTLRGDRYTANIGNYHIDASSPGDGATRYCLHRMINDGGGVPVIYGTQVLGASNFADVLAAMISGIQAAQEAASHGD